VVVEVILINFLIYINLVKKVKEESIFKGLKSYFYIIPA